MAHRFQRAFVALTFGLALIGAAAAHNNEPRHQREIFIPTLQDGRTATIVDLHTHSVFSDGHVWPTARVWEAAKDNLDAIAITEHLEYQPKIKDIPHPDRNRAYQVAVEAAARMPEAGLLVIAGAEITRDLPPGHVNAVFITDANALLTIDNREDHTLENARAALEEANRQGAFVFWNHPSWPRDFPNGVLVVPPEQQALLDEGLIHGIEVGNGHYMSEEALQVAIDNDLVILGTSDIHGLIDYDYDMEGGEHRTVTLALTGERTPDALKAALKNGETVALYDHQLIGRAPQVEAVVNAALSAELGQMRRGSTIRQVHLKNGSSIPMTLRLQGERRISNATSIITVPPYGRITVNLNDAGELDPVTLKFAVLNSFIGVDEHLTFDLVAQASD